MFFRFLILSIFLFVSSALFSQSSAVSNMTFTNSTKGKIIANRHSIALDLSPTFISVGVLNVANLFIKQPDGIEKKAISGNFGLGFNYHYSLIDKIHFETHLGINTAVLYFYEGYHHPMPNIDFGVLGAGNVDKYFLTRFIDIPISFGVRFYTSKKNNSGFYITPKIGGNIIFSLDKVETMRISVQNPTTGESDFLYKVSTNQLVVNAGLFVSVEIGFRIDINIKKLNDKGIKPFFDISILDIGYYILPYFSKDYAFGEAGVVTDTLGKYKQLLNIRAVPIPKIAFGVRF